LSSGSSSLRRIGQDLILVKHEPLALPAIFPPPWA
jgi:hypothetical protein